MSPKPFSPFKWVDTHGIPLEMVVKRCVARGMNINYVLMLFAYDAICSGWTARKVRSEISELKNFGFVIPKWFDSARVGQEHS